MYCYKPKRFEEMTAFLAHEVKNPVALIKANIELLELDKTLDIYQKNINIMKKELNKITEVVSNFIFLYEDTSEKNLAEVNLYDLIAEMIDDFSTSMKTANINFKLNCNLSDAVILGEYSKIYILFLNIYKNAVESIRKLGDINTFIYKINKNIIIDIVDNGGGIRDDIKENIGTPFFTSKPEGSGLGISICNNIIKELNGKFEIFNNKGEKGCTARVIFKHI